MSGGFTNGNGAKHAKRIQKMLPSGKLTVYCEKIHHFSWVNQRTFWMCHGFKFANCECHYSLANTNSSNPSDQPEQLHDPWNISRKLWSCRRSPRRSSASRWISCRPSSWNRLQYLKCYRPDRKSSDLHWWCQWDFFLLVSKHRCISWRKNAKKKPCPKTCETDSH